METVYEMNNEGWNEQKDQDYTNETREEAGESQTINEETEKVNDHEESETTTEDEKESPETRAKMTTDEVVEAINDEYENGAGSSKMRIGDVAFVNCFDADAEKAKSKNPKKETTYGDVCDHKKLRMDSKELGRCIRAAVQKDEFETAGVDTVGFSFYAFLEVAKHPNKDERLKLGPRVKDEGLKVRDIRKVVDDWKKAEADKPITGKEAFKLLKQLKGILTNDRLRKFLANEEVLEKDLESPDRMTLNAIATHMVKQMNEWPEILDNTRKTIVKIESAEEEAAA